MDLPTTYLARYWPLDNVVPGPGLQHYPTRTTFSISADQGRFVVKAYDDQSALGLVHPAPETIDRHLSVFEYLAGKGFGHAPGLLRTRSGERYIQASGTTIYIIEEIDGRTPSGTVETWAELGRIAALLNAYADFPYEYGVTIEGTIAELTRIARHHSFEREFIEQVEKLKVLMNQPTGLIHGEINPANSVLSSDGRLYLVDWDAAGAGPWVLEAGYPLLTAFLTEELAFQRESTLAFYGAYSLGEVMTAEQLELVFTAALLHALRYLPFGNPRARWARIRFALEHKDELLSAMVDPPS